MPKGPRFIPAPAGNSVQAGCRGAGQPGSSPRLRGTDFRLRGQSSPIRGSSPRLRGTVRRHGAGFPVAGSSPRLRGTALTRDNRDIRPVRFIPAPAGEQRSLLNWIELAVHPRACGEQSRYSSQTHQPAAGSSPRLRGTDFRGYRLFGTVGRFIPAPAGNSEAWSSLPHGSPVHPRACGEQVRCDRHGLICNGSSPRLRGTVRIEKLCREYPGSSPRLRGTVLKDGAGGLVELRDAVHPRACGERPAAHHQADSPSAVHPRACGEQLISS